MRNGINGRKSSKSNRKGMGSQAADPGKAFKVDSKTGAVAKSHLAGKK